MKQHTRISLIGKGATAFFILLSALLNPNIWAQQARKALFIGNSYTAVNNLPQLTHFVAASAGDTLVYDASTPGGYTFQAHTTNTNTLNLIAQGDYDFVVLQEQSQLPSFPLAQVQTQCFPYATQLDSLIRLNNPCAETVFYRTWGRKNGDASNCPNWPPVCTYAGMDSLLALRYQMMADDNDAFVAPVGEVWKYIRNHYPAIELFDTDESHPSAAGSYAAAVTFYTTFFRKDPLLVSYDFTLLPWIAADIRTAARVVLFDSLSKWNIGNWDPAASFSVSYPYPWFVSFSNTSQNADLFVWDFGDGSIDTTPPGPVGHQYAINSPPCMVRLVAQNCHLSDTFQAYVTPDPVSISELNTGSGFFHPNPADRFISIEMNQEGPYHMKILDINGICAFSRSFFQKEIAVDVQELPPGIYILEVFTDDRITHRGKLLIKR